MADQNCSQPPRRSRRALLAMLAAGALVRPRLAMAEWLRNEVVIYADPALRQVLAALTARYPVTLRVFCAPPGQMLGLLAHNTQDDILIAQTPVIAQAQRDGLAAAGQRALWRNHLILAARAAGPAAVAFDKALLLAALGQGRIAVPDATPASTVDGAAVLDRMGLAGSLAGRVQGAANTADALGMLRAGSVALALCHRSEIAPGSDIHAAMTIPQTAYDPIEYSAALSKTAWSRHQNALLDALPHTPEAAAYGLETLA